MKRTTKECGDEAFSNYQSDSPSLDESNRGNSSGSIVLKKGPWTSAEDALLVEYVKKHGEGNWNAVQKHSGLSRCGKSCRLRWANHLRPNLKKGTFTAEEERLIIELHAKMGNKWARMATQLHGRTDNEIKNYWNTRIKRRQRAGLPLYPSDLCLQEFQENHQGQYNSGARGHLDPLHSNSCEMPEVIFDGLKSDNDVLPYVSALSDISVGGMLMKCLGSSQYYGCMAPKIHHHKRLRESSDLFPISIGSVQNGFPVFDPFQNDSVNKVSWSFGPSFPNDLDPSKSSVCLDVNQGGHSLSNDNSSTSQPVSGAGKLELPSLQYPQTDLGSWGTSLLPPLHESVDEFIQSPSPLDVFESDCPLPHNSGLLDALLHEAMNLSSAKNQPSGKSSNSSINTSGDVADNCTWVEYGEPISPVGHSFNSLFNDSGGSSLDEPPPKEAFTESIVKLEPADSDLIGVQENGPIKQLEYTRPDVLLASSWLEQSSDCQGPSCRDRPNCNTSW